MSYQTLLQALAFDKLRVMTPEGRATVRSLRHVQGSRSVEVILTEGKTKHTFAPGQVKPILKGFQDFRFEVINGASPVIERILELMTAKIGPYLLHGTLELPLPDAVASTLGLVSALHFPGSDLIEAKDLGRVRITETLQLFWQPLPTGTKQANDDDAGGWLPLHIEGLSAWLIEQGYAAELPATDFMTPGFAHLLQNDASKRKTYFFGITSN
jgi:hypothetical protein